MTLNGRSLTPLRRGPRERKYHKRFDFDPLFCGILVIDMYFHIFDPKIHLITL